MPLVNTALLIARSTIKLEAQASKQKHSQLLKANSAKRAKKL